MAVQLSKCAEIRAAVSNATLVRVTHCRDPRDFKDWGHEPPRSPITDALRAGTPALRTADVLVRSTPNFYQTPVPLTRSPGTLSTTGGEGRGEGLRFMESADAHWDGQPGRAPLS